MCYYVSEFNIILRPLVSLRIEFAIYHQLPPHKWDGRIDKLYL
jgi:hypothetical protein